MAEGLNKGGNVTLVTSCLVLDTLYSAYSNAANWQYLPAQLN